jgi:type I restriction enzyme R subunit
MVYNERGTVEDFIIQELKSPSLGWKYVEPQLMAERRKGDFEQPLIVDDLKNAVRKLNSCYELTDADLDFIVTSLRAIPTTIEGIRVFLDKFRNGFVVPLQKEGKERVLRIVDLQNYGNNEFTVTRQFKVEGLKATIRADIVLLVNGIPLVLIECKSPTAEKADWTDGYRQIKRYENEAPEVFKYVQFSMATDGLKTRYFPNSFCEENKDHLSSWKDPYPFSFEMKDDFKFAVYGLLAKQHVLDFVENFIFVKKEMDKSTKIMTRYMQYRATSKVFERVKKTLRKEQDSKFGLIWHWQGSGKTYTMAFSAWKLFHCPETQKPSIYIVVDRKDLEEQIEKDFSFIEVPLEKVESIKKLIENLKWGAEGKRGIFLVTVEKFSPKEIDQLRKEEPLEIQRQNVIVFADEVHRTQYGKFSTMMRSIFKNAFIFGFTGTPLSKVERNTFQKFCPKDELYLDRYSMLDALEDGFTVALNYEARLPDYHLQPQQLQEFSEFEEEEIQPLSSDEKRALSKKVSVTRAFVKKPKRIDRIVDDIVKHFREIVEPTELKALIVTIDREACVQYKNSIDKILPETTSEIVMTFSQNDKPIIKSYFERLKEKYQTSDVKEIHRKIVDNFKTKNEPKILIVTDMLITGFDAPNLWTMYLDKPLKEHRLLQAIARTNRPYQDRKKFGLIVDYIGILAELEKAFEKFEAQDSKALRIVIRKLDEEKEEFTQLLAQALEIFKAVKKENTRESLESALDLLADLETASKFEANIRNLMKSYEMLRGDPFLRPYLLDYIWLIKVYVAYYKKFLQAEVDELKIGELSKKTMQLIQETIDTKEINTIYQPLAIDQEYIELLKKTAPKTIGAPIDLIPSILVEARQHPNSPFFINLGREVERAYEQLRTRKLETQEAIQKMVTFSQRIVEWKKEEAEIGKEKYPLYEAIKIVLPETDKQKTIAFITRLLTHLESRKLLFKNWQNQRDIRRKAKAETRLMLLSEFKEHKNKIEDLTDGIINALEKTQ